MRHNRIRIALYCKGLTKSNRDPQGWDKTELKTGCRVKINDYELWIWKKMLGAHFWIFFLPLVNYQSAPRSWEKSRRNSDCNQLISFNRGIPTDPEGRPDWATAENTKDSGRWRNGERQAYMGDDRSRKRRFRDPASVGSVAYSKGMILKNYVFIKV